MNFMQKLIKGRGGAESGGEVVDYGRARERRNEGSTGFDLPRGFVPVTDSEVARLLAVMKTKEIEFYNVSDGHMVPRGVGFADYSVEESGSDSKTFNNSLHPEVGGYTWFRGFAVSLSGSQRIIFLAPWLQPWREGGAPDPMVYAPKGVATSEVLKVIRDYCKEKGAYIDSQMFDKPWERAQDQRLIN